jgi:NAD(P)-dependent dehydrogenase (short-subunit alcohol dehydrogenase family)
MEKLLKVLLIGGSGEIGQALIDLFDIQKYKVYWCDSKEFPLPMAGSRMFPWTNIDIVINLAAVMPKNSTQFKKAILVNCLGAADILEIFLPFMRTHGYGRIIMMSSIFSKINVPGQGVYSASKAFVDKLVKIAAIENAQYGVTINSIQLGYTGIGMGEPLESDYNKAKNKPAMKRFCTMEELYRTIDYIIDTEYLTGQNIALEGGIR